MILQAQRPEIWGCSDLFCLQILCQVSSERCLRGSKSRFWLVHSWTFRVVPETLLSHPCVFRSWCSISPFGGPESCGWGFYEVVNEACSPPTRCLLLLLGYSTIRLTLVQWRLTFCSSVPRISGADWVPGSPRPLPPDCSGWLTVNHSGQSW